MIDLDNIGDRLSVIMTLALTIVAFQLVVAEILPKVEYLTYLDKVFLSCFFGVAFVSLESAALTPSKLWFACLTR